MQQSRLPDILPIQKYRNGEEKEHFLNIMVMSVFNNFVCYIVHTYLSYLLYDNSNNTLFVENFARTNFRAFSCRSSICAKLRKNQYRIFEVFFAGARKFIRAKIFKLHILKKSSIKMLFQQNICAKLRENQYRILMFCGRCGKMSARKFLRIR